MEGNADDGWTFTAAKDYSGTTSFEFEIQDSESKIPGAVTLGAEPVNDSPIASNANAF